MMKKKLKINIQKMIISLMIMVISLILAAISQKYSQFETRMSWNQNEFNYNFFNVKIFLRFKCLLHK
jgi:hypothetical protein